MITNITRTPHLFDVLDIIEDDYEEALFTAVKRYRSFLPVMVPVMDGDITYDHRNDKYTVYFFLDTPILVAYLPIIFRSEEDNQFVVQTNCEVLI